MQNFEIINLQIQFVFYQKFISGITASNLILQSVFEYRVLSYRQMKATLKDVAGEEHHSTKTLPDNTIKI